jgi:hypothetical protein
MSLSRAASSHRKPATTGTSLKATSPSSSSSSVMSHDRSRASCKTIPPLNAISSFLLQRRVSSLVPKVIQQLLTSSSSSSCHIYLPLYLSSSVSSSEGQHVAERLKITYTCVSSEFLYFYHRLYTSFQEKRGKLNYVSSKTVGYD